MIEKQDKNDHVDNQKQKISLNKQNSVTKSEDKSSSWVEDAVKSKEHYPRCAFDEALPYTLSMAFHNSLKENISIRRENIEGIGHTYNMWDGLKGCDKTLEKAIGVVRANWLKGEFDKWLDASLGPWIIEKIVHNTSDPIMANLWMSYRLQEIFLNVTRDFVQYHQTHKVTPNKPDKSGNSASKPEE